MSDKTLTITTLVAYCDRLLDAGATRDFCPNGLQVEGRRPIRRIVSGVSSCVELFERAHDAGADAVLVHHGLFWEGAPRQLTGYLYRRVATLVAAGLHLVAYHLPLDRHGELGNNILAARGLDLSAIEPFAEYQGTTIGFRGRFDEPISSAALSARCRTLFGQEPLLLGGSESPIGSVGIVSGGAESEIHQAIALGLDAYITGEASEWVMNVARESGIRFFAAGHYATERLGIRALGEHLSTKFALAHEFIDIPNPV